MNYEVRYSILADTTEATAAFTKLQELVSRVNASMTKLNEAATAINKLGTSLKNLQGKEIKITVGGTTSKELERRATAIERLNAALRENAGLTSKLNGGTATGSSQSSTTGKTTNQLLPPSKQTSSSKSSSKTSKSSTPKQAPAVKPKELPPAIPKNLGYKLLGPTPLPNNGGIAMDMMKGMGVAYGITGAMSAVSNIVSQATEFDNTMQTVKNILKSNGDNYSESGFDSMQNIIRQTGMRTKFKATEVADAAKFLAMAGINTNDIKTAINPIADLSLIGDTDLGTTADYITNIMTAYNIPAKGMTAAADVMANTFTKTNVTITDIAEAYKYAAALLSEANVPFAEASAAIGVLGDAGIKGSQAGTTMRSIVANMLNPTKKQKAAWEKIGVSTRDENGNMRDLVDVFDDLNKKNLDAGAYFQLFNRTAASGAAALTTHSDKFRNVYNDAGSSYGLSRELADAKNNTLQGLWAQLVSVFTDDGITAFSGIQDQIREMLKSGIEWLKTDEAKTMFNDVTKALMEFVHLIIDATKWFFKFFDAFGPIIKTFVKFQLYIWPVVKAMQAFTMCFNVVQAMRSFIMTIKDLGSAYLALGKNAIVASKQVDAANGTRRFFGPVPKKEIDLSGGIFYDPVPSSERPGRWGRMKNRFGRTRLGKALAEPKVQQAIGGYGSAIGGMIGLAGATEQFTQEDANGWNYASGTLYSMASVASMFGGLPGLAIGGVLDLAGWGVSKIADYAKFNEELERTEGIYKDLAKAAKENSLLSTLDSVAEKSTKIANEAERSLRYHKQLLGLDDYQDTNDTGSESHKKFDDTISSLKDDGNNWSKRYITDLDGALNMIGAQNGDYFYEREPSFLKFGPKNSPIKISFSENNKNGQKFEKAFVDAISSEAAFGELSKDTNQKFLTQLGKNFKQGDISSLLSDINTYRNNFVVDAGPFIQSEFNEIRNIKSYEELVDKYSKPGALTNSPLWKYQTAMSIYSSLNDIDRLAASYQTAMQGGKYSDAFEAYKQISDILHPYTNQGLLFQQIANSKDAASELFGWDAKNQVYRNGLNDAKLAQLHASETLNALAPFLNIPEASMPEGLRNTITLLRSQLNYSNDYINAMNGKPKNGVVVKDPNDGMLKQYKNGSWYEFDGVVDDAISSGSYDVAKTAYGVGYGYGSSLRHGFSDGITGTSNWYELYNNLTDSYGNSLTSCLPSVRQLFNSWGITYGQNCSSEFSNGFSLNFSPGLTGLSQSNGGNNLPPDFHPGVSALSENYDATASFYSALNYKKNFGSSPQQPSGNSSDKSKDGSASTSGKKTTAPKINNGGTQNDINKTLNNAGGGGSGRGSGRGTKGDQSAYKPHYNNNTAAPKQVNVRIENLMSVKSIDMTKADNAAVIHSLKTQLTQALVDVVHDFDETWKP